METSPTTTTVDLPPPLPPTAADPEAALYRRETTDEGETGTTATLPVESNNNRDDDDDDSPFPALTADDKSPPAEQEIAAAAAAAASSGRSGSKNNLLWPWVVLFLIIMAGLAAMTYVLTAQAQADDFEQESVLIANTVLDAAAAQARATERYLNRMARTTSHRQSILNFTWPDPPLPLDLPAEDVLDVLVLAPVVEAADREAWQLYNQNDQSTFLRESIAGSSSTTTGASTSAAAAAAGAPLSTPFALHDLPRGGPLPADDDAALYVPVYLFAPAPVDEDNNNNNNGNADEDNDYYSIVNYDLLRHGDIGPMMEQTVHSRGAVSLRPLLSPLVELPQLLGSATPPRYYNSEQPAKLSSVWVQPIAGLREEADVVAVTGYYLGAFAWELVLAPAVPLLPRSSSVTVVVRDTCQNAFTFRINNNNNGVVFLGHGDGHDPNYDGVTRAFWQAPTDAAASEGAGLCSYYLTVYATRELEDSHSTVVPIVSAVLVFAIPVLLLLAFVCYDKYCRGVLKSYKNNAGESDDDDDDDSDDEEQQPKDKSSGGGGGGMEKAMALPTDPQMDIKATPQHFENATVLSAGIDGFSAWSSDRDAKEVFDLLESIHKSFDYIARRRHISKVETAGDSYVAVCGVPDPCPDDEGHAVVMVKFARDCVNKFHEIAASADAQADRSSLRLRVGVSSGSVTAGSLQGGQSRLQVFGETVEKAFHLESSGLADQVHLSQSTSELLIAAGKSRWIKPDLSHDIDGEKSYILVFKQTKGSRPKRAPPQRSNLDSKVENSPVHQTVEHSEKIQRLIDWNYEMLLLLLKSIVAQRSGTGGVNEFDAMVLDEVEYLIGEDGPPMSEVLEVLQMTAFELPPGQQQAFPGLVDLGVDVERQLKEYVSLIATMYGSSEEMPYNSYEHASYVMMTASTFYGQMKAPASMAKSDSINAILRNPFVQFCVLLSAMVHDVDNSGLERDELAADPRLMKLYGAQSSVQQNAIDQSWTALFDPRFDALRRTIYRNESELLAFRQLVVNCCMATDASNATLAGTRNERWIRAFRNKSESVDGESVNLKITCVLEHLMQAASLCHTMQDWQIYLKWSQRMFNQKRLRSTNLTESYYDNELGLFDDNVFQMAEQHVECRFFGENALEHFNHASENRRKWKKKGQKIAAQFEEKFG